MRDGPRTVVLLLAIIAVAGLSSALGETLSVGLSDIAMITGNVRNNNVARIVLHVDVPKQVQSARIDFAELTFPAFLTDTSQAAVSIVTHCAQTAWGRDKVTWTMPWKRHGGDFDSLSCSWYMALPGRKHPVALDITKTVRSWQRGRNNYGLFLKRPDAEGDGFLGERERLREALKSARVLFYFTPVKE
ncbi:DNRLRE domain-containing protein [candidate division WOR-3 bacterium]|nr:DNRLRE domain-containing protein [candidate division WOR-3 bacterium]